MPPPSVAIIEAPKWVKLKLLIQNVVKSLTMDFL